MQEITGKKTQIKEFIKELYGSQKNAKQNKNLNYFIENTNIIPSGAQSYFQQYSQIKSQHFSQNNENVFHL